jgi:site-specific DNA-methyltransferase (adenine-specific)
MIPQALDSILQGDCLDVLSQLPRNSVDLVFADPPYYLQLSKSLRRPNATLVAAVEDDWDKFETIQDYDQFTRNWLSSCRLILRETGTLWVMGSYHNIYRVGAILQELGFWILNDVIWVKANPMPNFHGVRFTNAHETLIWAQKNKGSRYTFNHHAMKSLNEDLQMRSDWNLPLCTGKERLHAANGEKLHSTQKPEALLYRVLLSSTNPGDIVLDPFFGSGTTGAVARKLRRHFIGIEKNEHYIKAARERIDAITPFPESSLLTLEARSKPRIPFGALLEAGILEPGQKLYYVKDETLSATIMADGQICCKDLIGSIHSVSKTLSNGNPVNGWDSWLCEINGNKQSINKLRQKIQFEKASEIENNNKLY